MRAARCAPPDLAGVRATAADRLSSAAVAAATDRTRRRLVARPLEAGPAHIYMRNPPQIVLQYNSHD